MGRKEKADSPKYSSGFIVGLCILAVGTLGFLAGFASPYWHFSRRLEDGGTRVHGLWMTCDQESGTLSNCQDNIVRAEDLLRVVQFLESAAALLLLMACLAAVIINFTYSYPWRRMLDIFTAFGATLAVLGTLGYVFHILSSPSEDLEFQTFNWSFGINATGSLLCVLAAILIAACRAPPNTKDDMGKQPNAAKPKGKNSAKFKGKNSFKSKGNNVSTKSKAAKSKG